MKAVLYETFETPPKIVTVPDPHPTPDGVVIRVGASGVCRSDWHGWMGHDKDITLPHVPGHELAGTIEVVGRNVTRHVQVGLLLGDQANPPLPVAKIIAFELEIRGSHGMQAHRYGAMLGMILAGQVSPGDLISSRISLEEAPAALMQLPSATHRGMIIITDFS